MRVYFAPCGIGLGHVGRCIPIARELAKRSVEFTFSTYREGTSYIDQEGLPLLRAPSIGFQVKPDGTIDFKQTAVNPGPFLSTFVFLKQLNAELKFIEGFDPDLIVSDSRLSPIVAARILGIPRICILNQFQVIIPREKRFLRLAKYADFVTLTLIGKLWTSRNTVLIPDFPEPYTISVGNLNIPKHYKKSVCLIGPIISTRPDDLPEKERLRQKLGLPLDKPVIFAPISGPTTEKAFMTSVLTRMLLEFPEDYEIIVSLGYPNSDNRPLRHRNVTVFQWIPNRFEYLKACDLTISRAGHGTITQGMFYGKPMIIIPTPSHTEQLSNAKQAERLGIAKVIQQQELRKERLLENVREFRKNEIPKRASQVQREVMKHDGLQSAVDTIIETAKNNQVF